MGRKERAATHALQGGTRRQWGSDRRVAPLPRVPAPVSERKIMLGRLAIVFTVAAWFSYMFVTIVEQFVEGRASSARLVIEAIVYLVVVTALTASAMAYLITRIGFFYRSRAHHRAPRAEIDHFFTESVPTVTVLVPSYQEEERVVRTTLLSAALQEHPLLRVVLLVDDPPNPTTPKAAAMLESARALPGRVADELAEPFGHAVAALEHFEDMQTGDRQPSVDDMRELAGHYERSAQWLRGLGARQEMVDHADTFFVEHVLGALAHDLEVIALALRAGADQEASLPTDRLLELYRRLVATFRAELSSFERKQYVSCSHAPNKAMNLNSYIALMGGCYQEVATPLGRALVPCSPAQADLTVPQPDYVLTLDADSVLLPEYCARLLHLMEQPGFAKVAVAQTPYSAYPGAGTRLERIAGATTDIQHITHQGMTHYDATFWVGANALLRKQALDEIVAIDHEGNWEIRRYIQDHTVIEDTESTIDLGIHGWSLYNYPERLAYSATPPDFGSLCIQRQRWANGGLLILSKLREQSRVRRMHGERNRFGEVFLRTNYMASIFWSSLCLLILLIYPFNAGLLKPILPLIALPYFAMMAADLRSCGYKRLDVLRIYGFNLILLPVNLSGTFASILQLITGEKSSFKRTPKVRDRTTARAAFVLAPLVLIAYSTWVAVLDVQRELWNHLFFAALNASLAAFAMVAFVGLRNGMVDLWMQLRGWLYKPAARDREGGRRRHPLRGDRGLGVGAAPWFPRWPGGAAHRAGPARGCDPFVRPCAHPRASPGAGRRWDAVVDLLSGLHVLHRVPADRRPGERRRRRLRGTHSLRRRAVAAGEPGRGRERRPGVGAGRGDGPSGPGLGPSTAGRSLAGHQCVAGVGGRRGVVGESAARGALPDGGGTAAR